MAPRKYSPHRVIRFEGQFSIALAKTRFILQVPSADGAALGYEGKRQALCVKQSVIMTIPSGLT